MGASTKSKTKPVSAVTIQIRFLAAPGEEMSGALGKIIVDGKPLVGSQWKSLRECVKYLLENEERKTT